jgi:hypothetical protein
VHGIDGLSGNVIGGASRFEVCFERIQLFLKRHDYLLKTNKVYALIEIIAHFEMKNERSGRG